MSGGAAIIDGMPALERAYLDSHQRLIEHLARQLRCRHTAEDLAQDVFVAAREARPGQPIHNPQAFIFRIAHNLLINRVRQDARRAALRASQIDVLWTALDEVTPERQLLGEEALAQINVAVESLPGRTRQILAWRRIDGLTNREIACRLGISTTAVEKHMRTAMAALVRAISSDDAPSAG